MKISLAIDRRRVVPVEHAQALLRLGTVETVLGRFPKLRRLTRLAPDCYLLELQTLGSRLAKIAHDVSYAARYTLDPAAGELRWIPVSGHGNAHIGGCLRLHALGAMTELRFTAEGTLDEVPVPLLYRPIAGPFIQGKFDDLIERFLATTGNALITPAPTQRTS